MSGPGPIRDAAGRVSETVLSVRELHAYYGESHVLQGVSLDVAAGECVALLGRNGAGKTTTIAAIVGFVRPRSGSVRLRDIEVAGEAPHRIARAGLSLVPQGRRVFADLTVRENLALTAHARRDGWDIARVLDLFPSLRMRIDSLGDQLSGGEQQMLAIGRALMRNPRVLLLDEPSEGLAPNIVAEVGRTIGQLKAEGLSIVLVEQNIKLALELADDVVIVNTGSVAFHGTPAELRADEAVVHQHLGVY